ncbi:unnamed protein product [Discosporangium mesarthrocarpum]
MTTMKRMESYQESLRLISSILSAIRRCSALACDLAILPLVLKGCCCENTVAARHAFAILLEQAALNPVTVSQELLSSALLLPTTVGALMASSSGPGAGSRGGGSDSGPDGSSSGRGGLADQPNLTDPLACVYYLRCLKTLVFSGALDHTMQLDVYRTMAGSVSDGRHRVALEAMQCLMDHPRAWLLLMDVQKESHDADIFQRVVDRIKTCVVEATAPPPSPPGAPEHPSSSSRPGQQPRVSKTSPASGGGMRGKGKGGQAMPQGQGLGQGPGLRQGPGQGQKQRAMAEESFSHNWPLVHAACRVCRVVGRTFQAAMSKESRNGNVATGTGGAERGPHTTMQGPLSCPSSSSSTSGGGGGGGGGGVGSSGRLQGSDLLTASGQFNLLGLPPSPSPGVVEEQNTVAIRELCQTLQQHKLLECPHLHVRSLALEAMFLLIPDPSPKDPHLARLWDWLQQKMEQCPSTLPASVLGELVESLLMRVECSAASREEVIPIVLAITESFVYQVPSDEMSQCMLRAWCQCIGYRGPSRAKVLQSVYRVLDRWLTCTFESPHTAQSPSSKPRAKKMGGGRGRSRGSTERMHCGSLSRQSSGGANSSGSMSPASSQNRPVVVTDHLPSGGSRGGGGGGKGSPSSRGEGRTASWGKGVLGKGEGSSTGFRALRASYLRSRGAVMRLKRLAIWFLGKYCCELTGLAPPVPQDDSTARINPVRPGASAVEVATELQEISQQAAAAGAASGVEAASEGGGGGTTSTSQANEILRVWASSPVMDGEWDSLFSGGLLGNSEDRPGVLGGPGGPRVVMHPVVGAMNGAMMSLLMRLKHGAIFEDFQTRHACAAALGKVALQLPDPARFDAYCLLKDLSHLDLFPLEGSSPPHPPEPSAPGPAAMAVSNGTGGGRDGDWTGGGVFNRGEVEMAVRFERASSYGLSEIVGPVLKYLECRASSAAREKAGAPSSPAAAPHTCTPLSSFPAPSPTSSAVVSGVAGDCRSSNVNAAESNEDPMLLPQVLEGFRMLLDGDNRAAGP